MKQLLATLGIVFLILIVSAGTNTPTYSRGWELIKEDSVSNAATITVDLTPFTSYKSFRFEFYNVYPATDGDDIGIRLSKDASSYDATSTNYYSSWNYDISTTTSGGDGSQTGTYGVLFKVVSSTSARAGKIDFTIHNPWDTRYYPRIIYEGGFGNRWDAAEIHYTGQVTRVTAQATKGVRLIASTGNIYANVRVWATK
jgi:hypothetical protein